jgi:hypothetical protein
MLPHFKPQEEFASPPHSESDLRPDQKRCRKCRSSVLLDEKRCPFCGNAPWLWNPNSRFLLVMVGIALVIVLIFPLLNQDEPRRSTTLSGQR